MTCVGCFLADGVKHKAHVAFRLFSSPKVIYPICHDRWVEIKKNGQAIKTLAEYRLEPQDLIHE